MEIAAVPQGGPAGRDGFNARVGWENTSLRLPEVGRHLCVARSGGGCSGSPPTGALKGEQIRRQRSSKLGVVTMVLGQGFEGGGGFQTQL